MSKTIVAIFDNQDNAQRAAEQLKERGLRTDDISIVARQEGEENRGNITMEKDTGEGHSMEVKNDNISDGVLTGGILGGAAGLLIGAGGMFIPGLGIIAAAGPIAGLLSGAVTGGIVGSLIDLGIPEDRSKKYESDIKSGKILFSMKTDEDKIDEISSILKDNRAESVNNY
ncbi:UNVERIFIED_CONTAM: putative membrane protein [Acetivibrio alkalicellulosi]